MSSVEDMFDSIEVEETSAGEGQREMDRVPDGTYHTKVTDFSVFNTEKGDYFVSWWFEIVDGVANGAQLQSFSSVSPSSVKFIKRSVQRVTGKYPEWSAMFNEETGRTGSLRSEIVGKDVQVTQKTNSKNGKDYVNVYVDKLLKTNGAAPPAPPAKLPEAPTDGAGTKAADEDEVDVDDLF
tara:strand:+ start:26 stop:568 length:543 start_codon:yes stop_codon:yes gene_type:complete